mgnify:CR=1 FL=1
MELIELIFREFGDGMQEVRSSILLISTIKNLITTRFMSRVVIFYYMKNRRRLALGLAIKKTTVTSNRNCRFFIHSLRKRDRAWQQKCYATVPLHLTMLPEWDSGKRIRQPYLFGYGNRCFRQSL